MTSRINLDKIAVKAAHDVVEHGLQFSYRNGAAGLELICNGKPVGPNIPVTLRAKSLALVMSTSTQHGASRGYTQGLSEGARQGVVLGAAGAAKGSVKKTVTRDVDGNVETILEEQVQ